jgi:flagellar biogenesis protein FliO
MLSSAVNTPWKLAAFGLVAMIVMTFPATAQSNAAPADPAGPLLQPPPAAGIDGPPEALESEAPPAPSGQATDAFPAQAPESAPAPPKAPPAGEAEAASWIGVVFPAIKTVGAFGLVLSLVLVGFLVLRKFAPHYFNRRPSQRMLHLVETLSMGEKRAIAVVEVAGKKFLIGNTPNQITLLAPLGDELSLGPGTQPAVRPAQTSAAPVGIKRGQFVNLLLPGKGGTGRKTADASPLPPDIRSKMRELREALEG